jgi:hypothetical protein
MALFDELPLVSQPDGPVRELLFFEGISIGVSRKHCMDAMGPNEKGMYEFYYDLEQFEFFLEGRTLLGRAYKDEPGAAHLLAVKAAGRRKPLKVEDLHSTLARAAIHHFRSLGKTNLTWLDPSKGYSPIP